MKKSIMKKVVATALSMALVMGLTLSAGASGGSGGNTPEDVVEKIVGTKLPKIPETSTVGNVQTTVKGVYLAGNVKGSVVATPVAAISEGYGLKSNEKPYAKFATMNPKKSNLAYACLELGSKAMGADLGPVVDIELGKMTDGTYSLLSSEGSEIQITFGIPNDFAEAGKTFAVVRVRVGGVIDILKDIDTDDNTVTFLTTGGSGAYAIIKY